MIPQSLLAAAGLSVGDIVASRTFAVPLMQMLDIARGAATPQGAFFAFVNAYVSGIPGSTRQQAATAYRQAKFWDAQGSLLDTIDPGIVLDPRLAREVAVPSNRFQMGQNYRYHVDYNITFPGESKAQVFDVYIYSSFPLTGEGAVSQGWERLMELFKARSKPVEEGGTAPDWQMTYNITGFVNLVDRGY